MGLLYPKGHRWHHESNGPRTFVRDVCDYGMGAAALSWIGFLVSSTSGFGWMLGALAYTMLASYAHQIQHANPDLVFWMKRPVHRLHHDAGHIKGNYGVLVDWWDRLFRKLRADRTALRDAGARRTAQGVSRDTVAVKRQPLELVNAATIELPITDWLAFGRFQVIQGGRND